MNETPYTLYRGDCLEVMKSLPDGSVDAVITDPPYGLNYEYNEYNDTRENLIYLISRFIPQLRKLSNRTFILCGPTQISLYPEADWVMAVTWNTTGSFGKYGYNQWTPVLCYGKDLSGFGNVNGVMKTDHLKINGGGGVGFQKSKKEKGHPCSKAITIMNKVTERLTAPGDTILDPFMGSGTTGVACAKTGRNFIGIEIDEKYFGIAEKRIKDAYAQPLLFEA